MSRSPFLFQIYIEPDKGPITPVILNGFEIENKVFSYPSTVNRDEVRVHEIIKAITEVLPNVEPWSNTRDLSKLGRILSQISSFEQPSMYQGIVIRLPGTSENNNFYSCFISYSGKDDAFARRLYADLQSNNVRCWFAPHDMRIGDKIRPRIDESIRLYDKFLLILTEHSVASQWVEHEVETALGKELDGKPNILFPIRLDEAVMQSRTGWASHIRLTRHIGDFTRWKDHDDYEKAFTRLLRDLMA